MKKFQTNQYTRLELFAKSQSASLGQITVTDSHGKQIKEYAGEGYYRWIQMDLEKDQIYEVEIQGCKVSQSYLSGNAGLLDEGVCFLELEDGGSFREDEMITPVELRRHYDTPYREQYHFNPYRNWINDPNGLCWFQGRYHLFYQANPHEQKWDDMYWGHAASRDLIHWVHLPFVLQPQRELYGEPDRKGGAFSGSAAVLPDEVVFYLTRHYGPQTDCEETMEWQTMMRSRDMIHFSEEQEIIREKPKGAGYDFRDPKAVLVDGGWYMVLGSNLNREPAILLYHSEDLEHWVYTGPLLLEPDRGAATIECPDFFPLDGGYVAMGALMNHVDPQGRRQMTRCYIGAFDGRRLKTEKVQWMDFGSNYYAVQTFEQEGRRIAIGWISDFYGEHVTVQGGAYGSFALPRELHLREGRLYARPAREVYDLLDRKLYEGRKTVLLDDIPGNQYYGKIRFREPVDFQMLLGQDEGGRKRIELTRRNGVTQIATTGVQSEGIRFEADVENVLEVEVFVDRRTVEVYINKGEAAGTKVFYNSASRGCFQIRAKEEQKLEWVELYSMRTIW